MLKDCVNIYYDNNNYNDLFLIFLISICYYLWKCLLDYSKWCFRASGSQTSQCSDPLT